MVGIHYVFVQTDSTGYFVNRSNERSATDGDIADAWIEGLVGIAQILRSGLLLGLSVSFPKGFMTCLVEKIRSSHTYKKHLQDGVPHEHASQYRSIRYEVILQIQ